MVAQPKDTESELVVDTGSEGSDSTSHSAEHVWVGAVVRCLREQNNVSARALCKHAHISTMQLWRIEQKKASPTEETIRSLARALGVPAATLLGAAPAESAVEQDQKGAAVREQETRKRLREIQQQLSDIQQQLDIAYEGSSGTAHHLESSTGIAPIRWARLTSKGDAYARFRVDCTDAIGLLAEITTIFRDTNVNILLLHADASSNPVHIIIGIEKTTRATLDFLANSLSETKGITGVEIQVRSSTGD